MDITKGGNESGKHSCLNTLLTIFIENKKGGTTRKQEVHKMRYLFDSELEMICDSVGFSIESKCEWMGNKTPDFNSWNVVWIIRKI